MINRIEKQISEAEWQISKLEEEIVQMDKMLADPPYTLKPEIQ